MLHLVVLSCLPVLSRPLALTDLPPESLLSFHYPR